MKASVRSFSNGRVRHDAVFVLEALQIVVYTVFPHVFPKRAVTRQPPHQSTPAVLIQSLNRLWYRRIPCHLAVDKIAMTIQIAPKTPH